jgi:hypothetical protein
MLSCPGSTEELYLARGDVPAHRPYLQGDVFVDVTIPSVGTPHKYAMIATHPCTMRRGGRLVERVRMVPVTQHDEIPLERWSDSHFRVFPLPEMLEGTSFAAKLDETGMVQTVELDFRQRRAVLSDSGILLFQQRMIFADSRAAIRLKTLEQASAPILAEADLLEEWNERLVGSAEGVDQSESVRREAEAFDAFLGTTVGEMTLRQMLRDEHRRSAVRKAVRAELRRREET